MTPRTPIPYDLPEWMRPIAEAAAVVRPEELSAFLPPDSGGRRSAVLMLFGESERVGRSVPDLLIIERAHDMRSHAGQPAFPGGAVDPGDDGPIGAALREAAEETGVDPAGVAVVGTLPDLWLPPSGFVVTPVLAWWRQPTPVSVMDPAEVASVHRVALDDLLHPDNRLRVRHPSGHQGPAFRVHGLLVWGFTAGLLSRLLEVAGLERPWDRTRVEDLPDDLLRMAMRSAAHPGLLRDGPEGPA
ncbi:MAG TPA: CoA pyrophosphatase [Jiangellales bacterium]|nr:CoA pyrophosphatase [Jiangellales bacterium]